MRTRTIVAAATAIACALACVSLRAGAQTYPSASPSPSASATPSAAPGSGSRPSSSGIISRRTLIHPGDQLSVQVFGDQSLTQTTMVLSDGTVDYPLIGRVKVGGKTPDQAASVLASHMLEYVRHPVVTVAITQLAQPDVLVLGDVKNPGKYNLPSDGRLTDAIAAAGGLVNTNGAFPDARIADPDGQVTNVSLQKLLQNGQTSLDERLEEGSVVYVPGPIQFNIDVTGAVDHPGEIQVNEGDHLSAAVAKAGNSQNAHSDLNHIRLIRTSPDGKQTTSEVNLYDALQKGDIAADPALQKGDVIYIPEAYQHRTDFGSGLLYLLTRIIP
ncbi:MAG: polysaccharide biosynthesis/export family protein [Candidatus Eremiobacteraeota bacterium]|nr:polysaccharide biosynthesis/export family protein [Candidatus Eremiobacteraeota bacterium]